jgi:acyl-CoA synthetase (AMP-forming)/AMP-acid ligase II
MERTLPRCALQRSSSARSCLASDFVVLVLSETVLSETVLVIDGCLRRHRCLAPIQTPSSGPRAVATCRQTVEAFLTPPQRVPGTNSTPRPYMLRISWKSKIPHNL